MWVRLWVGLGWETGFIIGWMICISCLEIYPTPVSESKRLLWLNTYVKSLPPTPSPYC